MEWPATMGGGYHFLKLEGHYRDNGSEVGYATHLGTNMMLVKCVIPAAVLDIRGGQTQQVKLTMNLNEWYQNPQTYSFKADGDYSMNDMALMAKLRNNARDVFTLQTQ
jgi:hypothetical protein